MYKFVMIFLKNFDFVFIFWVIYILKKDICKRKIYFVYGKVFLSFVSMVVVLLILRIVNWIYRFGK